MLNHGPKILACLPVLRMPKSLLGSISANITFWRRISQRLKRNDLTEEQCHVAQTRLHKIQHRSFLIPHSQIWIHYPQFYLHRRTFCKITFLVLQGIWVKRMNCYCLTRNHSMYMYLKVPNTNVCDLKIFLIHIPRWPYSLGMLNCLCHGPVNFNKGVWKVPPVHIFVPHMEKSLCIVRISHLWMGLMIVNWGGRVMNLDMHIIYFA